MVANAPRPLAADTSIPDAKEGHESGGSRHGTSRVARWEPCEGNEYRSLGRKGKGSTPGRGGCISSRERGELRLDGLRCGKLAEDTGCDGNHAGEGRKADDRNDADDPAQPLDIALRRKVALTIPNRLRDGFGLATVEAGRFELAGCGEGVEGVCGHWPTPWGGVSERRDYQRTVDPCRDLVGVPTRHLRAEVAGGSIVESDTCADVARPCSSFPQGGDPLN